VRRVRVGSVNGHRPLTGRCGRGTVALRLTLSQNLLTTFMRIVMRGLAIGAGVGALAGLMLGLINYPPTAWFAVIELGIPGAVVGMLVGAVVGTVVVARRPSRSRRAQAG
jgi:hypothetical protein